MRIRMIGAAVLLLLLAGPAAAQSPFALLHMGEDVRSFDARTDGRGGWGVAESDTVIPCFDNIAGLTGLKKVAVVLSGYGDLRTATVDGAERRSSNVRTPTVRAAVPFARGRLVLSAGFQALRATQYDTREELALDLLDPDTGEVMETVEGLRYRLREGTQFEVPLGASYRVHPRLSVAASVNLVNGVIRERLTESFLGTSEEDALFLALNSEVVEDAFDAVSATWGLQAEPVDGVRVGFRYTTPQNWSVTRINDMTGLAGDVQRDYEVHVPALWAAGADVAVSERWRAGLEYEAQAFSELTGRTDWQQISTDAWRFGVGVERAGSDRRRGGWSNLPLRLGASVQVLPYTMQGEEIRRTTLSVGTGVPLRGGNGHLDVALARLWTGDAAKHGVEDAGWRLTVSLAGLERWW
ncbi:MAG TPA: hypothetical protein P5571_01935 [Candidatus Krumholzibacteria bacterium]|nr:hypothetical protein [Candidatus Krumholzibacteria bacterium]HRX50111.1 hypothetical protein [Candidatus Krumholzibacteria bacterium]